MKIDKKTLSMVVDEELEGTIEEIAEELPENAPRYLVLSYPLVSHSTVHLASDFELNSRCYRPTKTAECLTP